MMVLLAMNMVFQSTPSKRRATIKYCFNYPGCHISIHALQAESDCSHLSINGATMLISIHALQAESDFSRNLYHFKLLRFQSTPSKRRATISLKHTLMKLKRFQSTPSKRRATAKVYHTDPAMQAQSVHFAQIIL